MKWHKSRPKTLVEELIELGEDPHMLRAAASEYYENRPMLGRYLVENGVVSADRVAVALARQSQRRGDLAAASSHLEDASSSLTQRIVTTLGAFNRLLEKLGRRDG